METLANLYFWFEWLLLVGLPDIIGKAIISGKPASKDVSSIPAEGFSLIFNLHWLFNVY